MSPKKKFKWSSHQPVIYTAIELLKPNFILELGIGNYSSPLFINSNAKKIIHIENDNKWINLVKTNFQFDNRSEIIFHELESGIINSTKRKKVSEKFLNDATEYYINLKDKIENFNYDKKLLFVDHYASLRVLSINILSKHFDFVIYHDAEAPEEYEYNLLDTALLEKFDHYVLKTDSSWTGFYINQGLTDRTTLQTTIYNHSEKFGKPFNIPISSFKLERQL
jgi:hypothetical protein